MHSSNPRKRLLLLPRTITYSGWKFTCPTCGTSACVIFMQLKDTLCIAHYFLALPLRARVLPCMWHTIAFHHKPTYVAKEVWKCSPVRTIYCLPLSWRKSWLHTTVNGPVEGATKAQSGKLPWAISNHCVQPNAWLWEPWSGYFIHNGLLTASLAGCTMPSSTSFAFLSVSSGFLQMFVLNILLINLLLPSRISFLHCIIYCFFA